MSCTCPTATSHTGFQTGQLPMHALLLGGTWSQNGTYAGAGSKRDIWVFSLISLQRSPSLQSKVPYISSNSQPPLIQTEDTCCPKASGLPCGYVPISHEPVDQLFSHNAVGMCPQPVPMVLKFHTTVMMADFLPQIFQLNWVLDKEMCKLITSLISALAPRAST